MQEYEAIICGAGVGGLAMAVALGRQGRRVLLIEKRQTEKVVHKGEFLQPRTLHILNEWGVLHRLQARSPLQACILECRNASGELMSILDYRLLPTPFNYGLVHYYHEIKNALLTEAGNLVEIRYGTRMLDLLRGSDGRVQGIRLVRGTREEEAMANLIVGADGRLSTLRNQAGIACHMYQYPHQMLALDLVNVTNLKPHILSFLTRDGVRTLYPMPDNRARLYVQIQTGEYQSIKQRGMETWRRWLVETTPALQTVADQIPDDFTEAQVFGAWRFSASSMTAPGVALLGDAAHGVHPMAAQGMNAAIADAWTLSQEVQVQSNLLTEQLVDQALVRYGNERRFQFEQSAALSHKMALLCTTTSPIARAIAQRLIRSCRFNRRIQYMVTSNMSGLGVYRFTWRDRLYQFGLLPDPRATTVDSTRNAMHLIPTSQN